ncbi:flagellar motor switch phosphatase FliY [Ferviditalea candida]|uniref:Flagellar motor switch phosphatase FliY n=1 Tax=Ferviditalea candida TaxID=3108399 RepID=A0ABU5ZF82_9BACL|nr:flagellar motor switch phosphatase FliY [Paenibacillaceae bacterium T2]
MANNKDYLSQEEIDALLSKAAEGDSLKESSGTSVEVDDYLSPLEQDALGEIGNITFGSAATALSALLGRKVDITTPKVSVIARTQLEEEFPQPHVAVHVNYVEGFQGINLLVIKTEDAQVIADLMLGGEGKVESGIELNEIHISAVQEAMNQMMGSSATSMSTIFNRFVNISPPGINVFDLSESGSAETFPPDDVFVKISFRLIIGDLIDSSIMQLLTVSFAKELVSSLMGGSGDSAEASAAAETSASAEPQPVSASVPSTAEIPAAGSLPPQQAQPTYSPPPYPQQGYQQSFQQPYQQPYPPYQQPPQRMPGPDYGMARPNRNINVQPVQYTNFNDIPANFADTSNLNLLLDIPLKVTVELGRTEKLIKDILDLSTGSIIELDKLAGEPVDILVNNVLIAKGEVVVIDENFGVRVTDIISQIDRIQKLQ